MVTQDDWLRAAGIREDASPLFKQALVDSRSVTVPYSPSGYLLSEPIELAGGTPYGHQILRSEVPGLRLYATNENPLIVAKGSYNLVSGFCLDMGSVKGDMPAILLDPKDSVNQTHRYCDLLFQNCRCGVRGSGSSHTNFATDIEFLDCRWWLHRGIQVDLWNLPTRGFMSFRRCRIDGTGNSDAWHYDAFRARDVAGLLLEDFDVLGAGGQVYDRDAVGVRISGGSYVELLDRVLVDSWQGTGFALSDLDDVTFAGNIQAWTNGNGFVLNGVTNSTLNGITAHGDRGDPTAVQQTHGLEMWDCKNVKVDARLYNHTSYGLSLNGCGGYDIRAMLRDNGAPGAYRDKRDRGGQLVLT